MRKRLVGLVVAIAIVVVTMPIISVSAKTDIQIGDYIQMGTYFGEPILWRCVDKDGNGPLMLSDKIIDIKAFDAAGENTQGSHGGYYSARLSNGSNNWADSNIRAWLNSNESAGNTTWPCGNAPSYSNEEGFLKSFTSKELQLIKSVSQDSLIGEFEYENMSQYGSAIHEFNTNIQNVVTNANTTAYKEKVADSVFLLDVNQINTVYKNLGDYYIGYPTNIVVEKYGHKDGSLYINKPWRTLLRTPNANQYNNGTLVRAVIETGLVTGNAEAADTLQSGIRPAFYLNMSYAVFKSGLGTIENPYTVEGSGSSTEPIPTVGPFIPSTTPEPEIESHDFEVNKYRAEYLMNNNSGNTMENYYFNLTNTPSHIFFNAGIDSGLYTTTSAWDGITKLADGTESISKIADYTIEKKDLYSAIIFKMFQTSVDYKIVDTIEENSKIDELNLAKDITSIAKNIFNFDVIGSKKISDMTYDEKNELQQASERFFKSKYGTGDFEKYVGIISSGMDYANDIEGYFELLANYINMRQLNDSMKQVMSEMYKTATDNDMKAALSDCIRVMNASDKDFVNQMAMAFAGSAGKGVAQYMLDKMWDIVTDAFKAAHPAAYAFKAAYDAGKFVSNVAFNTDEICEKYLDMEAVVEAEDTLKKTYNNLKSKYKKSKTESNAGVYNKAIDIMFNMLDADCDYARDFADSVGSSAAGTLNHVLGNNGVENRKKEIDSIQKDYNLEHENVLTSWIFQLQEDDYDLYEQYKHLLDESDKRIMKKYNINCPVDVYLYNSSGGLEGSIVDNKPYCSDENNLTIVVEGDKKTVYFYDDNEYDIRYVGNDTGTMNITVTEYDDEQNETRKVNFNDIALENGTEYTSTDNGSNMSSYVIKDEYSGSIDSDFDSQNAGGRQYTAKLNRGYFSTFDLSKQLYPGENPEITAYVPDGYEFVNWESNIGEDIFDDADSQTTTICMPSRNVEITATIEKRSIAISDVTSSSVTVQTTGCARLADGTIILAAYDNSGTLQYVDAKPVSDRVVFNGVNGENYNIKAMLWDSVNGMMPLVDYADKKTPAMPSTPTPTRIFLRMRQVSPQPCVCPTMTLRLPPR